MGELSYDVVPASKLNLNVNDRGGESKPIKACNIHFENFSTL